MGFAKQLKIARQKDKNKYTQQDIADILGIDASAYSNYETGKREPNVAKLKEIAKILNVSVDFLLETGLEKPNLYSMQEKEFLNKFKQLSPSRQNKINKYLDIELEEQEEYTKKQYLKIARGGQEELVSSKYIDEMIAQGEQVFSDDDL